MREGARQYSLKGLLVVVSLTIGFAAALRHAGTWPRLASAPSANDTVFSPWFLTALGVLVVAVFLAARRRVADTFMGPVAARSGLWLLLVSLGTIRGASTRSYVAIHMMAVLYATSLVATALFMRVHLRRWLARVRRGDVPHYRIERLEAGDAPPPLYAVAPFARYDAIVVADSAMGGPVFRSAPDRIAVGAVIADPHKERVRSNWWVSVFGLVLLATIGEHAALAVAVFDRYPRLPETIVAGFDSACALTRDGTLACWGSNRYGQLGIVSANRHSARPVAIRDFDGVRQVSIGGSHACAVKRDHSVFCWGLNDSGQLGDGTRTDRHRPTPVGLADVEEVAAGTLFTCARTLSGDVYCWGANTFGQLGDGTPEGRTQPVRVHEVRDVVQLAAGYGHVCARGGDGSVWCWGNNSAGQLGDGGDQPSATPRQIAGLVATVSIAVGNAHSCALDRRGEVLCWGRNDSGETRSADGPEDGVLRHVAHHGLQLYVGGSRTCVRGAERRVHCVGSDLAVDRGSSLGPPAESSPIWSDVVDVAVGTWTVCALRVDGRAGCWGDNGYEQRGPGIEGAFFEVPGTRLGTRSGR